MRLDWKTSVEQGDEIRIALDGQPDPVWRETFDRVAALWERETRGQTWDGVQLEADGRGVVVYGIDPEETRSHDLRTYLADLLEAVDREADRTRDREARQAVQDQQSAESRAAGIRRLADELRDSE